MAPNYSLEKIKEFAAAGDACIQLSNRARTEAFNEFGFSVADVCEEVQLLQAADFYKSDISKLNGLPLDAYRKRILSKVTNKYYLTYIKFQIIQQLIVVSFHTSDY